MPRIDFRKDVLTRSKETPILVDFWAPWCGPCQFLGPILEELVKEQKGKWELVKINVDEFPEVSQQYSVRSIPEVKLFYDGRPLAFFTGALAKHQIEAWLQENLPNERKNEFEVIKSHLEEGTPGSVQELENFARRYPDIQEAKLLLALERVFISPGLATEYITSIKAGSKYFEAAQNIRQLAKLMKLEIDTGSAIDDKLNVVKEALKDGQKDTAVHYLIEAVSIDKTYLDELPRKATVALFQLLGDQHQITKKYRKRFDMALY